MDGIIALMFLLLGAICMSLAVSYYERKDGFGMILSSITAAVCFVQFASRINS